MTLTTMLFMTLTGSLIFLKIGLIVFGLLLLVRGTMRASDPGSMDPNYVEVHVQNRLNSST